MTILYKCDSPRPWGLYFQDSASPQMEAIIELHNYVMYFLIITLVAVMWIMLDIVIKFTDNKFSNVHLTHGTLIELIWTISPALILILIAFPSFKLLYITDDVTDAELTLKLEAHQWYWTYEYGDFLNKDDEFITYDSYMTSESELEKGRLRMLDVDNRIILPELSHARFNISSTDVIHSVASPTLGLKSDAYPFKTNQLSVYSNREGTYFGQCSEICGIWHSSMPIVIESVSLEKFLIFLRSP
jgi:heme/copper-type cytochrome/quinol oxidase subunit 2